MEGRGDGIMRSIRAADLEKKVYRLLKELNLRFNPQVMERLCGSVEGEYHQYFCELFRKNAEIAARASLPLCQDTGFVEFYVEVGRNVVLEEPVFKTLNRAVSNVYTEFPFRYSMVDPPLGPSKNTEDNTPTFVHVELTEGEGVSIAAHVKGGGSENLTALWMFLPTASEEEINNAIEDHIRSKGGRSCPPLHVGIGVGGSADTALFMAKRALLRNLGERSPIPFVARWEEKLFFRLNKLKIGVQGFGEGPTVLDVHILTQPRHIAVLPVAVAVDCFLCRVGRVSL